MKIKTVQMIDVGDWDDLVEKTYGRPYSFQQQDGCKDRGTFNLTVPEGTGDEDFGNEVEEDVDTYTMGCTFTAWLARDPKQDVKGGYLDLWWQRNFYPDIQLIANDLHKKGLLEAGKYVINIDW